MESSSPSVPFLNGAWLTVGALAATTVELLFPVTVTAVEAEFDWSFDTECCAATGAVTKVALGVGLCSLARICRQSAHGTLDVDSHPHIDDA